MAEERQLIRQRRTSGSLSSIVSNGAEYSVIVLVLNKEHKQKRIIQLYSMFELCICIQCLNCCISRFSRKIFLLGGVLRSVLLYGQHMQASCYVRKTDDRLEDHFE